MTTELEEQFFKVFGIKPIFRYFVQSELPIVGTDHCRPTYDLTKEQFKNFALSRAKGYKLVKVVKIYPEITDRRLLEMICIWNYIMPCIDDCIIPIDYLGLKSIVLDKMIRYSEIEYEFDVDALKYQIQQLFKE